jgi:acetyltransferase-like isoleucine patch superfamily enzyme
MDVKIGKNTEIGEGSVIGWGSVIPSGKFSPRSLLAGNPASVKKQDVIWSRERPNHFLSE